MYFLLRFISYLLGLLSEKAVNRLADFLAFLSWDLFSYRKKLVRRNLLRALGSKFDAKQKDRIAKVSYKNFILTILEFLRSPYVDISSRTEIEGAEHVKGALEQGQGVYVLCWHMGNWEAMASAISRQLIPATLVVKKVGSHEVDRFVTELRRHNGVSPIVRQKKGDGYRGIVASLDSNHMVGFPMDQARPGSPRLDFFGEPAKTNLSFAGILEKRSAPVLPGFIRRVGEGSHIVTFGPEIELAGGSTQEERILNRSLQFNKIIEGYVLKYPEHYFWLHNRWK